MVTEDSVVYYNYSIIGTFTVKLKVVAEWEEVKPDATKGVMQKTGDFSASLKLQGGCPGRLMRSGRSRVGSPYAQITVAPGWTHILSPGAPETSEGCLSLPLFQTGRCRLQMGSCGCAVAERPSRPGPPEPEPEHPEPESVISCLL